MASCTIPLWKILCAIVAYLYYHILYVAQDQFAFPRVIFVISPYI
uniref:Uncharacterized protein n=1 Tax=Arundo donax TaxID=35708 RepID=A0A0A9DLA7_ARUDO